MLKRDYASVLGQVALSPLQLATLRACLRFQMREAADPYSLGFDDGLNLVYRCLSGNLADDEFEDAHCLNPPPQVLTPAQPAIPSREVAGAVSALSWEQLESLSFLLEELARPTWHQSALLKGTSSAENEFWRGRGQALLLVACASRPALSRT